MRTPPLRLHRHAAIVAGALSSCASLGAVAGVARNARASPAAVLLLLSALEQRPVHSVGALRLSVCGCAMAALLSLCLLFGLWADVEPPLLLGALLLCACLAILDRAAQQAQTARAGFAVRVRATLASAARATPACALGAIVDTYIVRRSQRGSWAFAALRRLVLLACAAGAALATFAAGETALATALVALLAVLQVADAALAASYWRRGDAGSVALDVTFDAQGKARGETRRSRLGSCCLCCCGGCCVVVWLLLLASLSLYGLMAAAAYDPHGSAWAARHRRLRGVNLGGWLLTERWLVGSWLPGLGGNASFGQLSTACCGLIPSPYNVSTTWEEQGDEHALSSWLRETNSTARLEEFRRDYVTKADFESIASLGMNSVRLPIGYWVCVSEEEARPYLPGRGWGYIDDAVRWAGESGLSIIIDLHGANGSQNGQDTSGREWPRHGPAAWSPAYFDAAGSVEIIRQLAARYASSEAVIGIELLNEPELPTNTLLEYYRAASSAVRQHMPPERVAVIINIYGTPNILTEAWGSFNWQLPASQHPTIVYDLHIYCAFPPRALENVPLWLLTGPYVEIAGMALSLMGRPTFVGEWSLGLPWYGSVPSEVEAMSAAEHDRFMTGFAARQVDVFTRGNRIGGYFWTWNANDVPAGWGIELAMRRGWIAPGQWAA